MSERYRLVFRGEVLEGQHPAVVKQRLGALLKVDEARLETLFTGKAVTIRKDADSDTAAKFQIAFKRAGARLRVVTIDVEPEEAERADAQADGAGSGGVAKSTGDESEDGGLRLAPLGVTLVEPRPEVPAPAMDISHMTLAAPGVVLGTPSTHRPVAPDVGHMTLAAPGTALGAASLPAAAAVDPPAWELANVGVELVAAAPEIDPPLDIDAIAFDLSPPGTLLGDANDEPPPAPPDTSHLKLE